MAGEVELASAIGQAVRCKSKEHMDSDYAVVVIPVLVDLVPQRA
jgi:hypothetical protein